MWERETLHRYGAHSSFEKQEEEKPNPKNQNNGKESATGMAGLPPSHHGRNEEEEEEEGKSGALEVPCEPSPSPPPSSNGSALVHGEYRGVALETPL